jgi:hypothetical protein
MGDGQFIQHWLWRSLPHETRNGEHDHGVRVTDRVEPSVDEEAEATSRREPPAAGAANRELVPLGRDAAVDTEDLRDRTEIERRGVVEDQGGDPM